MSILYSPVSGGDDINIILRLLSNCADTPLACEYQIDPIGDWEHAVIQLLRSQINAWLSLSEKKSI